MERTLFFLQRQAEGGGGDVDQLVADTKADLEDAHRQQARGCRMQANIQWAEEGEASTAYFSNLERRRGASRLFTALRTLSGQVVSSLTLILRAWVAFYVRLFSAQPLDVGEQDFFF